MSEKATARGKNAIYSREFNVSSACVFKKIITLIKKKEEGGREGEMQIADHMHSVCAPSIVVLMMMSIYSANFHIHTAQGEHWLVQSLN